MGLQAGLNHVVVRPIGDLSLDSSGLAIAEYIDNWLLSSCLGVVQSVGDLWYGGNELAELGSRPRGHKLARAQRINELSLEFDVPCEIAPGDLVLYKYISNVDKDALHAGDLIVKYDQMLAKITGPGLPGLYPLNGAIFMEVRDHAFRVGGLAVQSFREPGWGVVVAEGCRVNNYLYWPEKKPDHEVSLVGKEVCFKNEMAVRIEHDAYRNLNLGLQYPLYYLHRLQINAYLNGE